jgi:hypothetical protein
MCLLPFDYRTAARHWGADDPEVALAVDAVVGGTPGYRDLVDAPTPATFDQLGGWLAATVLNPSHALFAEADYLLREDPRLADRSVYHSILTAIAEGARAPTAIGAWIGRDRTALAHPLGVLRATGFVHNDEDLLWKRRPSLTLTDPIVRFTQLVVTPRLAVFEDRRWEAGWRAAAPAFASGVLGPHFEHLAREWTRRFAAPDAVGGEIGELGRTVVNDPSGRAQHEIDVAALAPGHRRQSPGSMVTLLGEAKSSSSLRSVGDLTRLERIRALLVARQAAVPDATLLLFGRSGFDAELRRIADHRADVVLVDLDRLYHGN